MTTNWAPFPAGSGAVMAGQPAPGAVRAAQAGAGGRTRPWRAYVVLLVLFAFMGPYSLHRSSADEAQQGAEALRTAAAQSGGGVEEGAKTRRVAILALGLFAALTLSEVRRRRTAQGGGGQWEAVAVSPTGDTRFQSPVVWRAAPEANPLTGAPARRTALAWFLLAYFGVAAASVAWAIDPGFTARRLIAFLVIAFAAFVLAQAWTLRDVVYFALIANLLPLLFGFLLSLARGDFHPFTPTYRFTGLAHPNVHGLEGACLVMAAFCALRLGGRRVPLVSILVFGAVLLYLTKSRTAVGAVVLAGAVCMMVAVSRRRLVIFGVALAAIAGSVLIFAPDVAGRAHEAALLERSAKSDDPATLSGRTLLWSDLMDYAAEKPVLGYGFDSFWTADHIAEISLRRGWVIIQAHSGYIQELLDTGVLGLSILVLILIAALRAAFVRYRVTRSPLALYALAMFVWYVATLIPEAVDLSHVSTFIVMVLLAHFALRTAAYDDDAPEQARLPAVRASAAAY
jgi:exopolysaccharide production protein ExoQ